LCAFVRVCADVLARAHSRQEAFRALTVAVWTRDIRDVLARGLRRVLELHGRLRVRYRRDVSELDVGPLSGWNVLLVWRNVVQQLQCGVCVPRRLGDCNACFGHLPCRALLVER
jgi:hypothetical protein